MMKNNLVAIFSIIFVIIFGAGYGNAYSQGEEIPSWIKSAAGWWANDEVGDDEFFNLIQFLVDRDIVKIPQSQDTKRVQELEAELDVLKRDSIKNVQNAYDDGYKDGMKDRNPKPETKKSQSEKPEISISGNAVHSTR